MRPRQSRDHPWKIGDAQSAHRVEIRRSVGNLSNSHRTHLKLRVDTLFGTEPITIEWIAGFNTNDILIDVDANAACTRWGGVHVRDASERAGARAAEFRAA